MYPPRVDTRRSSYKRIAHPVVVDARCLHDEKPSVGDIRSIGIIAQT